MTLQPLKYSRGRRGRTPAWAETQASRRKPQLRLVFKSTTIQSTKSKPGPLCSLSQGVNISEPRRPYCRGIITGAISQSWSDNEKIQNQSPGIKEKQGSSTMATNNTDPRAPKSPTPPAGNLTLLSENLGSTFSVPPDGVPVPESPTLT